MSEPLGLLICRDLFFNSKITGTAQALGLRVAVAGTREKALAHLQANPARVVFLDLAAGEAVGAEAIAAYRSTAPDAHLIAFGSHVDAEALRAARDAGCDQVMPRSKFTAILPDLIRHATNPAPMTDP